jgi:hypothetical protein
MAFCVAVVAALGAALALPALESACVGAGAPPPLAPAVAAFGAAVAACVAMPPHPETLPVPHIADFPFNA